MTDDARAEAERYYPIDHPEFLSARAVHVVAAHRSGFRAGAEWARTVTAEQVEAAARGLARVDPRVGHVWRKRIARIAFEAAGFEVES